VTDPGVLVEIALDLELAAPLTALLAEDLIVLVADLGSVAALDPQWPAHLQEALVATAQHHKVEDTKVVKIAVLRELACWRISRRAVNKIDGFMSVTFLTTLNGTI